MRFGAFLLFLAALILLSLLDGIVASLVAALLCGAGSVLVTSRQLRQAAVEEEDEPPLRVRVVRWNY